VERREYLPQRYGDSYALKNCVDTYKILSSKHKINAIDEEVTILIACRLGVGWVKPNNKNYSSKTRPIACRLGETQQ